MRGQDTIRRRKRRFGALCAALALALSALALPAWATDYTYDTNDETNGLEGGVFVNSGDTVSIYLSGDIEATVVYNTYQNEAETTLGTWNADHLGGIETYVHAIGSEQQQRGSWAPSAPDFTDRSKWKVIYASGGGESNYTLTLMEAFTVTFDGGAIGASYVPDPTLVAAGEAITEPIVEETPDGYESVIWYKDQALTQVWEFHYDDPQVAGDPVTADTTLYAKWQGEEYSVNLDANGGTELGNDWSIIRARFGEAMPALNEPEAHFIPERTNYVFTGYFDAQTGGTKYYNADGTSAKNWDKVVSEAAPATLYAQWAQSSYSVTLHPNGGTIGEGKNLTSYPYGVETALPTADDVTNAGYTFGGWYDNESLTGTAVTAIGATAQGNKEYWAKWTETSYDVLIAEGITGGTVTADKERAPAGATVTLTVAPNAGNTLDTLTVTAGTAAATAVTVTDNAFVMPAANVTVTATFRALDRTAEPVFTPAAGSYTGAQSVTLSCATEGAVIHYTTDGTEPTANSPVYDAPIEVTHSLTVKAFAVREGMTASAVVSAAYVIEAAPAGVTWSLADGVLTITGSGAMADYSRGGAPWFARRAEITSVVIDAGVTRVGNYAFYACGAVQSVMLCHTVTEVGSRAFAYCTGLSSVTCERMLAGETSESAQLTGIGEGAFYACFRLADQGFANGATIGNKAFELCGLGG